MITYNSFPGGSDDLGSLGSSDESEFQVQPNQGGTRGAGAVGGARGASRGAAGGSQGSNQSLNRRAPSTKPMQEIMSDDDF